jgi:formyl-CoA transferase
MKVGVAIVDLTAGMFALSSILAALRVRDMSGKGQKIDISLFDSQLAWLANVGSGYLVSGEVPGRYGNGHPNIVPYETFRAADGWLVLAVGNDRQWARFCEAVGRADWLEDARWSTNSDRVENRETLVGVLGEMFVGRTVGEWLELLREYGVPAGPVSSVAQALDGEVAQARGMVQEVEHPLIGRLRMVGSPLGLEGTPPAITSHPPMLGEHTEEVLAELGRRDVER